MYIWKARISNNPIIFQKDPPPARTNVIYRQVFRENSDEFYGAQKLHECTFMPFSVVECIHNYVFGLQGVSRELTQSIVYYRVQKASLGILLGGKISVMYVHFDI